MKESLEKLINKQVVLTQVRREMFALNLLGKLTKIGENCYQVQDRNNYAKFWFGDLREVNGKSVVIF